MKYVPLYKEIKTDRDDCYFIGSNTAAGFKWADKWTFGEKNLDRLYIIKGAAGTGKSTLMRKVADSCYDAGFPVKRFFCSSDPSSYDGVMIDGRVALLDGTAPHVAETEFPGAVSEIVNLANFWDTKKLVASREEIVFNSEKKKSLYDNSYRSLKGIKILTDGIFHDAGGTLDGEKAEKAALRMIKSIKKGNGGRGVFGAYVKSIGMKGRASLDTLKKKASTVVAVNDRFGTSYRFIEIIKDVFSAEGLEVMVSPDPLFGGRASDVFIPSASLLITNEEIDEPDKQINMDRFIDEARLKEAKGSLKLAERCVEELITDVENSLTEAGKYHFALEEIYGEAMNFDALNEYTKLLTRNILCEL